MLDHKSLRIIVNGLRGNVALRTLSLSYCSLFADTGDTLADLLRWPDSALRYRPSPSYHHCSTILHHDGWYRLNGSQIAEFGR
jgi:hypothetical protein